MLEASDGVRGLRLLLGEKVEVVLCDLEMPGIDGEKLLRMKARSPGGANVPFLFLTAHADADCKARLLESGACDALQKPFHPAELVARLRLHLQIKRLQDELLQKNEKLAWLSTVDPLTQLRSRRYGVEFLTIEFLRARRYGNALSSIMIDVDHFKRVNDQYGHATGDDVLRGVAQHVRANLRATDVGARWGGEELLLVLPQNNVAGARILAERLRESVAAARFTPPGDAEFGVTISVGVAEYEERFDTPEVLVAAADEALYKAKHGGRNRVVVYGD